MLENFNPPALLTDYLIPWGSTSPWRCEARRILEKIFSEDERILADPAPLVAPGELADSSVNFLARPWVNSADYSSVKWDTCEKVKLAFDAAGIGIPYPQMDVHVSKEAD